MMHAFRTLMVGFSVPLSLFAVAGCSSNSADSGAEYQNTLTFGTGVGGSGFDLLGEGTTFSVTALGSQAIWFKLGSAADMQGRAVRLYFNDGTYATKDYQNPQDYGHYLLSSFRLTDVGSFTVKANLVAQVGPDIGKETLVAQATLAMQP